jgi:hypothetical protein
MKCSSATATICVWALTLAACGGTSSDEAALEVGGSESETSTSAGTTSEDSSTDTETTAQT